MNVEDTIFWLSPTIESCNGIDFISVAYASWYHWNCGRTQRKAATINQFACPSYSLYVQLFWYPMYYPRGMKARVSPVQWSKPYSILAPTQDSNPGGRIQNHIKRWPLHYHCTLFMFYLCFQDVLQRLLKDPVIQQCRQRQLESTLPGAEDELIAGSMTGKQALQVSKLFIRIVILMNHDVSWNKFVIFQKFFWICKVRSATHSTNI